MTQELITTTALSFLIGFVIIKFIYRITKVDVKSEGGYEKVAESERFIEWWIVFDVSRDCSLEELKVAYKKLMSKYHPDKFANLTGEFSAIANRKSKEINLAYELALREKCGS
jgi:DnaJ-domain-containing protein 1